MIDKIWNWLNGKKQALGLLCGVLYYGMLQVNLINQDTRIESLIAALIGIGSVHKIVKKK